MNILITGASSYVGAKIYGDLKNKFDVVGTYHSNKLFPELEVLDITKKSHVEQFVQKNRPDIIIHVAANASRNWCEQNQDKAMAINQEGTKNITEAASSVHAKVIFISSLAVEDTQTLYGKTKVAGEEFVTQVTDGYVILRPSLIVGLSPNTTNDRLFNRFLKHLTGKSPAVYDTSWKFQATWLRHISEIIEIIIEKNIWNKIIPICVPELKTRYDIAKDILSEFNVNVVPEDKKDPTPIFSDDLHRLKELQLPVYTYNQMIEGIRKEIHGYLNAR